MKFGNVKARVVEGDTGPTQITILRENTSLSTPLSLMLYVETLDGFSRREFVANGCNLTLADLEVDETEVDPAEGRHINHPLNSYIPWHHSIKGSCMCCNLLIRR